MPTPPDPEEPVTAEAETVPLHGEAVMAEAAEPPNEIDSASGTPMGAAEADEPALRAAEESDEVSAGDEGVAEDLGGTAENDALEGSFGDLGTANEDASGGDLAAMPRPGESEDTLPGAPPSPEALRIAEALVFASATPVTAARLAPLLPPGVEAAATLAALAQTYEGRGVQLVNVAGGYAFRTAEDLAPALTRVVEVPRRLPRVAMEALAIIAWHQPVTRAEIEEIRGTALSQTTLETLLENGLVAPRGKKEAPGRPTLWATTPRFLEQFGLASLRDLPRREELMPEPGLPLPEPAPVAR